MAGGVGSRFWPQSRRRLPKQFLAIGADDRSLIRATFERLVPLTTAERVLVVANEAYRDLVFEQIPELAEHHFIGEPEGRNTAPCIGLAAHCVAHEDPDAQLLVCPADHVIGPNEEFLRTVRFATTLLAENSSGDDPTSVLFGISPTEPHTGYGYLEQGDELAASSGLESFRVAQFKEKPSREVAEKYVESGKFFWNSGIFLWTASGLVELMRKHLPDIAEGLQTIAGRLGDRQQFSEALTATFPTLRKESIDYGVLEPASNVVFVRASFRWDDVGSWGAVSEYLPRDEQGNSVKGRHLGHDTKNCVVVSQGRLVATVGVQDLVVVDTDDAILVCHRDSVEHVKKIVEALEEQGATELL
jgi:mannose-1-phosphate guanylyltransferase